MRTRFFFKLRKAVAILERITLQNYAVFDVAYWKWAFANFFLSAEKSYSSHEISLDIIQTALATSKRSAYIRISIINIWRIFLYFTDQS